MTIRQGFVISEEQLKEAERIFRQECTFVAGATSLDRIPPADLPEVAFAGRSNVGKSSLINALTNRKNLARSSNTPGRTQQINFFNLGGLLQMADLPGYGYAKVTRSKAHAWNNMVSQYLRSRMNLTRLCVLIDARHGLLAADHKALDIFDSAGVAYIGVLTKVDKIKKSELESRCEGVEDEMAKRKGAFPKVYSTSAEKGYGIPELRAILTMT
jgi:GTP-binding protein